MFLDQSNQPSPEESETLRLYVEKAKVTALLSVEEERELYKQVCVGREARQQFESVQTSAERQTLAEQIAMGNAAAEQLYMANGRLVASIVKRYVGRGMPVPELIAHANEGLLDGIADAAAQKGFVSGTRLNWWIRHAIGTAIKKGK